MSNLPQPVGFICAPGLKILQRLCIKVHPESLRNSPLSVLPPGALRGTLSRDHPHQLPAKSSVRALTPADNNSFLCWHFARVVMHFLHSLVGTTQCKTTHLIVCNLLLSWRLQVRMRIQDISHSSERLHTRLFGHTKYPLWYLAQVVVFTSNKQQCRSTNAVDQNATGHIKMQCLQCP